MRLLHERAALMNGISVMWSDKVSPLDEEAFCWTGSTDKRRTAGGSGENGEKTDQDHIVNVLAAQINKDGGFNLESVMKAYKDWTQPPATEQGTAEEKESTDGGR